MTSPARSNGPINQNDPALKAVLVTPSDTVDFDDGPCRALYVGTGGNLTVIFAGNTTSRLLANVGSGVIYPFSVSRVLSTGTTASGIVALY